MIDQSLTNTVIGVVQSLFIIPFIPTFWSILLLLVFVLMLLFGYYLIANQIKTGKKGTLELGGSNKKWVLCHILRMWC